MVRRQRVARTTGTTSGSTRARRTYAEYPGPVRGARLATHHQPEQQRDEPVQLLERLQPDQQPVELRAVASMTQASQLFGNPTYTRGSMTLDALRTVIGDVAYEKVMEQWQLRYTGESHRTADFIDLAEEISGRDLTAFFSAWIYTLGKPAWPAKFTLSLTGPTAPVLAALPATYTLTSRNTGKVARPGASSPSTCPTCWTTPPSSAFRPTRRWTAPPSRGTCHRPPWARARRRTSRSSSTRPRWARRSRPWPAPARWAARVRSARRASWSVRRPSPRRRRRPSPAVRRPWVRP